MTTHTGGDHQQLVDQAYEGAFGYESTYGVCPQCVLAAVDDVLELGAEDVFKAAHGLAGGGALSGQGTCGALIGALLAVGVRHGRERSDFANDDYMHAFALNKRVYDGFVQEFGSPICAEIQRKIMGRSYDLWNPKEFKAFLADGGHDDKCPHVAGTAARLAVRVLLEAERESPRRRNSSAK